MTPLSFRLPSAVDVRSTTFRRNRDDVLVQLDVIDRLLDRGAEGGGTVANERLRSRGKLPARDRIANVLDPDSPFLEISPLAGYDSDYTIGGGMIVGIGVIADVECVIVANDPSVLGGALTPYALKKWMRAIEISRTNRIPYVSFVESAGADLRVEVNDANRRRAQTTHFAETGRAFYELIELSKLRIPTVCVVFGSSTAGGAYQPGLSDYTIVVKEKSRIFLAGPPLVKMATGEVCDEESLGGALLHAETSGLADYFADDELDALRQCRDVIAHVPRRNRSGVADRDDSEYEAPGHSTDELLGLVSRDLRQALDIHEVIARIVDGSRFDEFKSRYGPTMVCGWASLHGHTIGILGNNGVIYPQAAEKAAHFVQLCNQLSLPILFLQNVTGYMVGREFEAAGSIKKGSQMINAVANSTVPHLTVILGSSYGAGTYGMSGRAFGNRFTFLWPTAKIAVMGPKQIAGVMSQVRQAKAQRSGAPFDVDADASIVAQTEAAQEVASLALAATGAVSDDGIIDPRDTREVLGLCLDIVCLRPVEGTSGYGVFRL